MRVLLCVLAASIMTTTAPADAGEPTKAETVTWLQGKISAWHTAELAQGQRDRWQVKECTIVYEDRHYSRRRQRIEHMGTHTVDLSKTDAAGFTIQSKLTDAPPRYVNLWFSSNGMNVTSVYKWKPSHVRKPGRVFAIRLNPNETGAVKRAKRLHKALKHLVKLCGGNAKKEPF